MLDIRGQTNIDLFTLDHDLSKSACLKGSSAQRFVYPPSTGVSKCFICSVERTLIGLLSIARCPKLFADRFETTPAQGDVCRHEKPCDVCVGPIHVAHLFALAFLVVISLSLRDGTGF